MAEAFGEELVHEGLFQLGGGLNDPLLRFDRPLHRRKDVRDLLLLGEWGERDWDALQLVALMSLWLTARAAIDLGGAESISTVIEIRIQELRCQSFVLSLIKAETQ